MIPMRSSEPIRVMLVDDHAVVRNGLAAFLSAFDDFKLVGEAADGVEAVSRGWGRSCGIV
jgi:DNA-binding NarL/FixJ family response regulator